MSLGREVDDTLLFGKNPHNEAVRKSNRGISNQEELVSMRAFDRREEALEEKQDVFEDGGIKELHHMEEADLAEYIRNVVRLRGQVSRLQVFKDSRLRDPGFRSQSCVEKNLPSQLVFGSNSREIGLRLAKELFSQKVAGLSLGKDGKITLFLEGKNYSSVFQSIQKEAEVEETIEVEVEGEEKDGKKGKKERKKEIVKKKILIPEQIPTTPCLVLFSGV